MANLILDDGADKERWIARVAYHIDTVLDYHNDYGAPFNTDYGLRNLNGLFDKIHRRLFVDRRVGVCSLKQGVAVCWVADDECAGVHHALGISDRGHRYITNLKQPDPQSVYLPKDTSDIVVISNVKDITSVLNDAAILIAEQAR